MDNKTNKHRFYIRGMDCAEEVIALKRVLVPLVGNEQLLVFDLLQSKLTVDAAESSLTIEQILQAIEQTGLDANLWDEQSQDAESRGLSSSSLRTWLVMLSGLTTALGFIVHAWTAGSVRLALESGETGSVTFPTLSSSLLYSLSIAFGIWFVLPKAWGSARRFRPDMNLLMVIAVIGAILIGQWLEAATVAFLFSLSNLLESWSIGRARRAIASLLDIAPSEVLIRQPDGAEATVPPKQVAVGTQFLVRPGGRIPLDGKVVAGSSAVNQAPITGESIPVDKTISDVVFAGSINGNGLLEIESTSTAQETVLAHIIQLVEEAQSRRAQAEQWVERFAQIYTPAVLVLAVAALLIPPFAWGQAWLASTYNALVLLVIACPCALVISTPVSVVAALTAAAKRGVLIKGGVFLEIPSQLAAIAFDKTGTLTLGKPVVKNMVPLSGHTEPELLNLAAGLEARSDHPLAHAILEYAASKGVQSTAAENLQVIQGKGATAIIDGQSYWIGSQKYLEERGQETSEIHAQLEEFAAEGHSVVVLGNEQHVCGFFTISDAVRPQARETLDRLRTLGIKHLVLLTGDNEPTANSLAEQVGITEIHAELLPEEKVAQVERLVKRYGSVAMIGDGINDAPALASATLGIAMGAAGSDAALETADIALLADDLTQLPWLVLHSRRTLSVIRQNITFSLSVKALFVVLTFVGWSSLWAAIAADTGASLLVVFNGLRLTSLRE